jgi:hypothetical protein
MTVLICGGRCIVCGDAVDPNYDGWEELEPSLCTGHALATIISRGRCQEVLPPRIRCARITGHDGKHLRYPLAWGVMAAGIGPPP